MAGQISTRFGVTGADAVERAFDNLAKKGEEVGRRTTAGVDSANDALNRFGAGASKASDETEKFNRVLQRNVDYVDSTARAKRRAADAEAVFKEAVTKGVITQADASRLMELNTAKLNAMISAQALASRGAADHAAATKLSAFQMQNLSYQLNDVAVSLASGQRPLTVLMQQGSQITPIFGGVAGTMRAAGEAVGRIVSPIGLAVTAAATLGAGFVLAMNRAADLDRQLKQLRVTLAATGAAPGLSAAQAQQQALAFARLPGVDRTTAQAASQVALANPLLTADLFAKVLPAARDFAAVAGKEIPDAMQDLVAAMFGGVEAASRLADRYDFLHVKDIERIRDLNEQGKVTEAATLLLDKFAAKMKGSADILQNDWSRATSAMGNAWDGFLDKLARTGPVQGARTAILDLLKDTTQALEGDLPRLARIAAVLTNPFAFLAQLAVSGVGAVTAAGPAPDTKAKIADITKQLTDAQELLKKIEANPNGQLANRGRALFGDDYIEQTRRKVDALVAELDRLKKAGQDASAAAGQGARDTTDAETERARREIAAAATGTAAGEIERARNALQKLQAQYDLTGVVPGEQGRDRRTGALLSVDETIKLIQLQDQYNGVIRGTLTYDQQWARTQREQQELLRTAVQDRAALAAKQQAYNEAIAKGKSEDEANRRGIEAFNLVKRQQADATGRALSALSAEAQASLAVADAYLKAGDGAAAYARELEKARIAVLSGQDLGTSPEDYARRQLANQAASGVAGIAERITALDREADSLLRVAAAERQSGVAGEDAARREQLLTEATKLRSLAIAAGNQDLVDYIDKIVPRYLQASDRVAAANRAVEAARLNRQFDSDAQLRDDLARLDKLRETGILSAKAFQAAWADAYIKAGTASDSWLQGATAGLLEYARQAQQVGGAVADAIVRAFGAADDAIAKLLLRRSVDFRQFLADISLDLTRAFVRQNITGPIAGFLGNLFTGTPSASGVGAVGGLGGDSHGGGSIGGGFNPLGLLGNGGGGLFGGGSGWLGDIGTWLRTPIGQTTVPWTVGGAGETMASGLSGWANGITPLQGIGALAGIGSGIFNLTQGNIVGGIGGIIGAGVSLIPGVGQIAGPIISIASSILGSLFKSKPDIKAQGWHDYDPVSGRYGGRQTFAQGIAAPIAPGVGNDALKLISAFGGSVAEGKLPPSYYIWAGKESGVFDATVTAEGSPTYARLLQEAFANGAGNIDQAQWAARKALWTDAGNVDLPIGDLTKDSDKLMQQLALLILKAGVRDNAFTGLSSTSQSIIRNFPDADTQGLASALQWGKSTYDVLVRTDTITAAEKAITDLKDSFQAAILKAKEYGLATDALVDAQARAINKYATDFGQSITDQLLGLSDPAALQRVQIERARDAALQEWDYLNEQYLAGTISTLIDRNKINELYDKQLLQVTSQTTADLTSLWQRLVYGDLSGGTPGATAAGTGASFQALLAQAMAGDGSAIAKLAGSGEDYVRASEAAYGHTQRFVDARDTVRAAIEYFMGGQVPQLGGANVNVPSTDLETIVRLYEASQQDVADLRMQVSLLLAKLDRLAA